MNIKQIDVGGISVDVVFKDIKNVHLSVHPPTGRVRISAPARMKLDTLRVYAISYRWTKTSKKFQNRSARPTITWTVKSLCLGQALSLKVQEEGRKPSVELKHNQMLLRVRPGATMEKREAVVTAWYRYLVANAVTPLVPKWEASLGVEANKIIVRRMKTRWGSCALSTGIIRLNTELAKKPRECLEYVLVHELIHLLEPSHNASFISLMDTFMPQWRYVRDELNRAPLGHVDWEY
jgi:predicted metal-dependent hydrolase